MSDEPTIPVTETPPDYDTPLAFSYHPAWGFIGVALGVAILIAVATAERFSLQDAPGTNIIYSEQGNTALSDTIPIGVRRVPMSEFPAISDMLDWLRNTINPAQTDELDSSLNAMNINSTEAIICIDWDTPTFKSLLSSGRLPEPGSREVLAGVHTRLNSFTLDEYQFNVVGRIAPSAAGLYFAYLLPRHETMESTFFSHDEATLGWFGMNSLSELRSTNPSPDELKKLNIVNPQIPTKTVHTLAAILGLLIVSIFGMLAHLSAFRIIYTRRCGPLRPAFRVFLHHPKLVLGMHVLMYGTFFGMMAFSYTHPVMNIWMNNLIRSAFEDGSVAYVGEAYASGNIPRAAWATFWNNYLIQTVGMTVLISLLLPLIGILKTMLSFALVGFGMVPGWAGMIDMYTFHSITMTLELEAYILTCVCVAWFWGNLVMGAYKHEFRTRLKQSTYALMSTTLLAGIMLALAALYEATTLILVRG